MGKKQYQEVPPPEEITDEVEKVRSGKLLDRRITGPEAEGPYLPSAQKAREHEEGKKWELVARESLTNFKGEIDSILSFKLPGKTRAEELATIHPRLLQKLTHAQDSDRKFSRQENEGASAYLKEKIKAIEAELNQ